MLILFRETCGQLTFTIEQIYFVLSALFVFFSQLVTGSIPDTKSKYTCESKLSFLRESYKWLLDLADIELNKHRLKRSMKLEMSYSALSEFLSLHFKILCWWFPVLKTIKSLLERILSDVAWSRKSCSMLLLKCQYALRQGLATCGGNKLENWKKSDSKISLLSLRKRLRIR